MGAALTYARRYGLFTLVGIAGEDDLNAPDLDADPTDSAEKMGPPSQSNGQTAGARRTPDGDRKRAEASARSVLGDQLSASLRESLIEQLSSVNSADDAAAWAHRNMPAKNKLAAADAKMVEERFQARLLQIDQPGNETPPSAPAGPAKMLERPPSDGRPNDPPTQHASAGMVITPTTAAATRRKRSVNSSLQAFGKTVRLRDKDHRRFVLRQA
jgi:hypothetical protein